MDTQRARIFGTVAQEYDRTRPTYPTAFFDDVVAFARLDGLPALDVGAGTGKATLPLARRGLRVTAVEPDADMAAVLSERVGHLPVDVVVSPFEDFQPPQPYGLLICAQAWHWLDLATRWQRAANALTVGGALVLCWNGDRLSDEFVEHLKAAYAAQVGEVGPAQTHREPDEFWTQFQAQPAFTDQAYRRYDWSRTMPAVDVVANLGTYSQFLILDPVVRDAFFADLTGRLDDEIVVDLRTHAFFARRLG